MSQELTSAEAMSYLAEIIDAARAGGAPREHIQALQLAREALGTVSSNNKSFRESIMKIHENRFERISRDEALKEESK